MALGKKIKETSVVSRVCDGLIRNRMIEQCIRQACFLLDVGATPLKADMAIEKFALAMGPFRMADLDPYGGRRLPCLGRRRADLGAPAAQPRNGYRRWTHKAHQPTDLNHTSKE